MSRQNRAKGETEWNGHRERGGGGEETGDYGPSTHIGIQHTTSVNCSSKEGKGKSSWPAIIIAEKRGKRKLLISFSFISACEKSTHYRGAPFINWPINQIVRLSSKKCLYTHIGYDILF
jgi:hypothetical protein